MTDPAARRVPRLVVQTREIEHIDDLLAYAGPGDTLAWMRRGDGMVALGGEHSGPVLYIRVADRPESFGRGGRLAELATSWRAVADAATVHDEVGLPGTGLVAFGAFAFDDRSASASTLVVPRTILGRRAGRSWITRIRSARGDAPELAPATIPYGPYWSGTLGPGAQDPSGYQSSVRDALDAIDRGEVGKVVLARDLVGTVPAGSDLRRLARALATGYPDCWTYAVDGIVGASPETLVTVSGGTVTARVLAGTIPRGPDADADAAASLALATSAKDRDEHLYAVRDVLASLRPHTSALASSNQPFTLTLPNVFHLATDVEGELSDGSSALDLVGALHPTAAVAGTPTAAALEVIGRLEPFDRGRYAGPVGWVDGDGDGEWAIALRCAQFGGAATIDGSAWRLRDTVPVTAHAGAGIVAGSDPETELLETRVKFRPIVEALA